jgi:uncharacterized protein
MGMEKLNHLRAWFEAQASVVVAYSGGVDSSLVMCVADQVLGKHCTGVLAVSPSLPEVERYEAIQQAEAWGWQLQELETTETEDPNYQINAPNRCFHCKDHVYRSLLEMARGLENEAVLVDGMNAEDTQDLRPGRAAAIRHGVKSPLNELGFTKAEVREAAQFLGLIVWDKPAAACLASRIPYGTKVTNELLRRIESAESFVRSLGIRDLRVRHHGDVVRIEVPTSDFNLVLQHFQTLVGRLKEMGWLYVTLDMEGIRQGSLNAPLLKST